MAIYVKFKVTDNLSKFLEGFFSHQSGSELKSIETYHDEECTKLQCPANKYRSFDALEECVKTYFPNVTLKELMRTLISLNLKNGYRLIMSCCSDIRRIVLYFHSHYKISYGEIELMSRYDSRYSWKDLLDLAEIKTKEEFIKLTNGEI